MVRVVQNCRDGGGSQNHGDLTAPREQKPPIQQATVQISAQDMATFLETAITKTLGAELCGLQTIVQSLDEKIENLTILEVIESANIRMSMTHLQNDITSIKQGLRESRESLGQLFYRFRELPREIQTMIWEAALDSPRILVVRRMAFENEQVPVMTSDASRDHFSSNISPLGAGFYFSPPSHGRLFLPFGNRETHSAIRKSCREARIVANARQVTIYDRRKYWSPRRFTVPVNPDVYVNSENDTIWFLGTPKGRGVHRSDQSDPWLRFVLRSLRLGNLKVAITLVQWGWELHIGLAGLMSALGHARELIIVVGFISVEASKDLIFVQPGEELNSSWMSLYSMWNDFVAQWNRTLNLNGPPNGTPPRVIDKYSWDALATCIMEFLPAYNQIQLRKRKSLLQSGEPWLDVDMNEHLKEFSLENFSSIRFVEATTPRKLAREGRFKYTRVEP